MTVQLEVPTSQVDVARGQRCPMERVLTAIGNRTALLLVREAFYGASRFDQLRRRVGVTEPVAARWLRELVDAGVLAKEPYREEGQRTRDAYVLTPAGAELLPVVLGLLQWGARHAPGETTAEVSHEGCGAPVEVVPRCAAGHDVVDPDEVRVRVSAARSRAGS